MNMSFAPAAPFQGLSIEATSCSYTGQQVSLRENCIQACLRGQQNKPKKFPTINVIMIGARFLIRVNGPFQYVQELLASVYWIFSAMG